MTECSAKTLHYPIERLHMGFWVGIIVFTTCSVAIMVLLVHYGNEMENTSRMESFIVQAKDSDTHMRLMASDIRHRVVALQSRMIEHDDQFSASELQHIIMVADRISDYPYFWVLRQDEPQNGGGS
jgi:hypothetical protein